jgi:hypothetical protein
VALTRSNAADGQLRADATPCIHKDVGASE